MVDVKYVFLLAGCDKELMILPVENLKIEYGEKLDKDKAFLYKRF